MTTTWIVVANAAEARIYVNSGPNKGISLHKDLKHPQSREKAADLVTDRPGHNRSAGTGHGSFVPQTDPKQVEADSFAIELARELDSGRIANQYQRIVVAAAPSFLGHLNQHLSSHVSQLISDTVAKDYTKANDKELAGHMEKYICV